MTAVVDEAETLRTRLVAALDKADARSRRIAFWWRDDDAETATPALDRLLGIARAYDLPLALAVVPKRADTALAKRLADEPRVAVLQHGWQHRNHAAEGKKKIELGGDRPIDEILDELRQGRARLHTLFGARALPVLVPPWNRLADPVRDRRAEASLAGLSTYGPVAAGDAHAVNTHLDMFEWKPRRRTLTCAEAFARLIAEVDRRLDGSDEPVGLLTHHLVHDGESWEMLEQLLATIAHHPAVKWPEISTLFGL